MAKKSLLDYSDYQHVIYVEREFDPLLPNRLLTEAANNSYILTSKQITEILGTKPRGIDEEADIDAVLTENGDLEIVDPAFEFDLNDYSVTASDFAYLSYRELQEKVKYHRTVDAPIKLNSKRETLIEYLLTH